MKTNLEKKMIYLIPCLNLLQLVAVSVALFCTDSFNPVAKTIMALVTAALGIMFVVICSWISAGGKSFSQEKADKEERVDLAA